MRQLEAWNKAMAALVRCAEDLCARVRAEHERAVRDVMERVRTAICDVDEKAEDAKVTATDAEEEVKEATEWMKNAEG